MLPSSAHLSASLAARRCMATLSGKRNSPLDVALLTKLSHLTRVSHELAPLPTLVHQYQEHAGRVLPDHLPYESAPPSGRRVQFTTQAGKSPLVMVAHVAIDGLEHKISLSSGFAIGKHPSSSPTSISVLSCAHTLEEIRHSPLARSGSRTLRTGSFVVTPSGYVLPITGIHSSLPLSDMILYAIPATASMDLPTLPISPYPAPIGTPIQAHLFSLDDPGFPEGQWSSLPLSSRWVKGSLLGYRDRAGRESTPGTYDSLAHILFKPIPTSGSSGGPIVDENSGAVVGMISGHGLVNRVEGQRGFGTPAEAIYEMFSLPGLAL